jgi:hypothetical protein
VIGPGWARVDADVAWPDDAGRYGGVKATRSVTVADGYLLDVLTVSARDERTFDLVSLPRGQVDVAADIDRASAEHLKGAPAYAVVREVGTLPLRATTVFHRPDRATLRLCMPSDVDEIRILGSGPANPATTSVSVLVRRATGRSARFVSVLVPRWPDDASGEPDIVWSTDLTRVSVDIGAGAQMWSLTDPTLRSDQPA